jgi:hypothetical protein
VIRQFGISLGAICVLTVVSLSAQATTGRITPAGVARAQAVVDSVFLDRKAREGFIEGGDWASYLMVRLGVTPLPDSVGIVVATDSQAITFTGRIQDLPAEAQAMLGPLVALLDPSTVLAAEVVQLPSGKGIAHFQLSRVTVGGFPVPEIVLRSMLLNIGDSYPELTKSGRDLFVQIPPDGAVLLVKDGVRLAAPPIGPGEELSP